jgi:AcrR family transcriptional regulator
MSRHAYHAALSDTKRAGIVAAARALFLERGYSRVSMAEIAGAAGVSSATLYRHFDSKTALLTAVVEALVGRLADTLGVVELPEGDLPAGLGAFADAYSRLLQDTEVVAVTRLMIAETPAIPEPAQIFMAAMKGPVVDRFGAYLARNLPPGASSDPVLAITIFLGSMERLLMARLLNPTASPQPGYREAIIKEALASFAGRHRL